MFRSAEVTLEGYKKVFSIAPSMFLARLLTFLHEQYPNGLFRVPLLQEWLVFCSGPQLLEDIRKADSSEISFNQAIDNVVVLHVVTSRVC